MRFVRDGARRESRGRTALLLARRARAIVAGLAGAAAVTSGCTLLVQFHDDPGEEADAGDDAPDDTTASTDGGIEGAPLRDAAPIDAVYCPADANGLAWRPPDDTARCCGGKAVFTTTVENCGACGIRCNVAAGQTCAKVVDNYYCIGCNDADAGGNAACWSGCCSVSFYKQGLCAASVCATGACNPAVCPAGTKCKTPPASSNYCGYD